MIVGMTPDIAKAKENACVLFTKIKMFEVIQISGFAKGMKCVCGDQLRGLAVLCCLAEQ